MADAQVLNAEAAASLPPLLFLHGFAQSAATWDEVRALLPDIPTATIDWPGHGHDRGNRNRSAYTLSAAAELLADELRQLWEAYPDRPAPIVVGYSMGGRLLVSALNHWRSGENPARLLGGIVLESAGLGPVDDTDRATRAKRNHQWTELLRQKGLVPFFDYWETLPLFATQADQPKDRRARLRAERLANDPESLALSLEKAGVHRMALQAEGISLLEATAREGTPVLYLAGEHDRTYRDVAATLRTYADGELPISTVLFAKVGHNIHYEDPNRYAETLRDFAVQVASTTPWRSLPNKANPPRVDPNERK